MSLSHTPVGILRPEPSELSPLKPELGSPQLPIPLLEPPVKEGKLPVVCRLVVAMDVRPLPRPEGKASSPEMPLEAPPPPPRLPRGFEKDGIPSDDNELRVPDPVS